MRNIIAQQPLIPDPADRLSKADRPPPCAVIAVALINRIPYHSVRFPPRLCENTIALVRRARSRRKAVGVGNDGSQQTCTAQRNCWLPLRHGVFTQPAPKAAVYFPCAHAQVGPESVSGIRGGSTGPCSTAVEVVSGQAQAQAGLHGGAVVQHEPVG